MQRNPLCLSLLSLAGLGRRTQEMSTKAQPLPVLPYVDADNFPMVAGDEEALVVAAGTAFSKCPEHQGCCQRVKRHSKAPFLSDI
ncbi:hypothetical protein GQ54DRAFT_299245 [Martensiomyces pterosporus]|nr:hypothetical protein GQ54DRAFT_299245 [Martensiomyces pterosporus]